MDLIPKNVKNSDFLSILYSEPQREFRKPKFKFKIGDKAHTSKLGWPFKKGNTPQFTQEVFENVAFSAPPFRKPPTYTLEDGED